jgi:hypothetical protein
MGVMADEDRDICGWETEDGTPCRSKASEPDGTCYRPQHGNDEVQASAYVRGDLDELCDALRDHDKIPKVAENCEFQERRIRELLNDDDVPDKVQNRVNEAWKPTKDRLAGEGRNRLEYLSRHADDERVQLEAAKALINNYDTDQEPDKVEQQIEQQIDDQRDPEADDEAVGEALELLSGDGEAA